MVFAKGENVLSSSLIDESVLDKKDQIELYTSEVNKANPLHADLI